MLIGSIAATLAGMLRIWAGAQKKLFTVWGAPPPPDFAAFLHDPLTVQALVDPAPLRMESLRIVPTIESGTLRTLEVPADLGIGTPMTVATDVDAPAAAEAIVSALERV